MLAVPPPYSWASIVPDVVVVKTSGAGLVDAVRRLGVAIRDLLHRCLAVARWFRHRGDRHVVEEAAAEPVAAVVGLLVPVTPVLTADLVGLAPQVVRLVELGRLEQQR